ncbi:MAG TPA: tetratricopeptide repeat protein, partial [Usitatibacter sp.]|nr:tetratricopeptide repeat protein [Usitatibacter sp.]
ALAAEKADTGSSALLSGLRAQESARTNDAIAAYELALHHGDTSGVAANNLAWIYASRGVQLDRALELANVANKNKPEDPAVLDTLGYVLLKRRQYSESATILEHALELAHRPNGDHTIVAALEEHLAEAYVRSGRPEAAAKLRQTQRQ